MSRRAVFLDRDGVLSRPVVVAGKPRSPMRAADFEVLPDVADVCRYLRGVGYLLVVVTNQPEIARGRLATADVDAMHAVLASEVPLDDIRICPHDDADGCGCRKPNPGMLLAAARQHDVDLRRSFLVGDRWRDIAAGRRAGCRTVLVDHHWAEPASEGADAIVADLAEAAAWITDQPDLTQGQGAA